MAIVAGMFAPAVAVFISMGDSNSAGFVGWIAAIVAALLGGLIVFLIYRKKRVFVPDPPPPIILSENEIRARADAAAKWERIEKAWWYRYPVAGLMFLGAWLLWHWKPQLWWISLIGVLYGLMLAKEIGLLALYLCLAGIGIGLAIAIFHGLASIPVSVAIIVGALIIAGAVSR